MGSDPPTPIDIWFTKWNYSYHCNPTGFNNQPTLWSANHFGALRVRAGLFLGTADPWVGARSGLEDEDSSAASVGSPSGNASWWYLSGELDCVHIGHPAAIPQSYNYRLETQQDEIQVRMVCGICSASDEGRVSLTPDPVAGNPIV